MISGVIPTELQYNTDVVSAGSGTNIDKSTDGKIKINNINYGYALPQLFNYDITSGATGTLISSSNKFNPSTASTGTGLIFRAKPYENMVRLHIGTGVLNGNINIYIDDSINKWKLGQTVKFTFKDEIPLLGSNKINIYTEKNNGWLLKAEIDTFDIIGLKPYFELVCVDETNKTFELEIIR